MPLTIIPAIVGSSVCRTALLDIRLEHLFLAEFPRALVSFPGLLNSNHNLTHTRCRFTFKGGSNVTLEGTQDSNWGWVSSNGQQVREALLPTYSRVLTNMRQWWDAMQTLKSRVNRPHGWSFNKITNGEIKYMKLWQVSVGSTRLGYLPLNLFVTARSLEF